MVQAYEKNNCGDKGDEGEEDGTSSKMKLTWEKLGFQNDLTPETDVRGAGLLGVLILTQLAETQPAKICQILEAANRGP